MSERDIGELGESLREHRTRVGMPQRRLAELAGISVRTIRNIERGHIERLQPAMRLQLNAALASTAHLEPVHGLRIDILGPLSLRHGGEIIELRSARQRWLLGLLALQANKIVPLAEIVDLLWDDQPPATYRQMLHTVVSRLRKLLAEPLIHSRHNGYTLEIDPARLDLRAEARHGTGSACRRVGRVARCGT